MSLYFLTIPAVFLHTLDHPRDRLVQRLSQHRSTGLPDGRQAFKCPRTRTTMLQLAHLDAVRQKDHIHVSAPGNLATAFSQLTIAHAQPPGVLVAVLMEALRTTPAATIHTKD